MRITCSRRTSGCYPLRFVGYAEKNLVPGENLEYRARYHWVIYRSSLLGLLLALLLAGGGIYAWRVDPADPTGRWIGLTALIFGAIAGIMAIIRRVRISADEFVVTNRRVIRKVGLVSREIEQAPLDKIQDITVDQGWLGRLLGFGTVSLETASERGTLVFPTISEPEGLRNALWGHAPAAASGPSLTAPAGLPPGERLKELDRLRQQGLVSDEEYAAKRREILAHL
ncbi:MAG TPA: PH domain-containing protein [Thermoanaerobaculia bacterium]